MTMCCDYLALDALLDVTWMGLYLQALGGTGLELQALKRRYNLPDEVLSLPIHGRP
jgi:hypothetical protein